MVGGKVAGGLPWWLDVAPPRVEPACLTIKISRGTEDASAGPLHRVLSLAARAVKQATPRSRRPSFEAGSSPSSASTNPWTLCNPRRGASIRPSPEITPLEYGLDFSLPHNPLLACGYRALETATSSPKAGNLGTPHITVPEKLSPPLASSFCPCRRRHLIIPTFPSAF